MKWRRRRELEMMDTAEMSAFIFLIGKLYRQNSKYFMTWLALNFVHRTPEWRNLGIYITKQWLRRQERKRGKNQSSISCLFASIRKNFGPILSRHLPCLMVRKFDTLIGSPKKLYWSVDMPLKWSQKLTISKLIFKFWNWHESPWISRLSFFLF